MDLIMKKKQLVNSNKLSFIYVIIIFMNYKYLYLKCFQNEKQLKLLQHLQ